MAESNREREARHLAWLADGGNAERLASESPAAYADQGRGFWFCSSALGVNVETTRMYYLPRSAIRAHLPAGTDRNVLNKMVRTYDPAIQIVVVIEEQGRWSAYKVRVIERADPGLN